MKSSLRTTRCSGKIILKRVKDHPEHRALRIRYITAATREAAAENMRRLMNHEGLKQFWIDWEIKAISKISEAEYVRNTQRR